MAAKRALKDQPLEISGLVSSSDEEASGEEVSVGHIGVFFTVFPNYRNTPHMARNDCDSEVSLVLSDCEIHGHLIRNV